jgi:hypothetical protein
MFRLSYLVPFLTATALAYEALSRCLPFGDRFREYSPWGFFQMIFMGGTNYLTAMPWYFSILAVTLTLGLFYLLAWPWTKVLSQLVQWWGRSAS